MQGNVKVKVIGKVQLEVIDRSLDNVKFSTHPGDYTKLDSRGQAGY